MDAQSPPVAVEPPHEILTPERQTLPLVFASPHSGNCYPPDFVAASRLDPLSLRRSEDSFVDELFSWAPRLGAPLIRALFPRAFVDPNREPYELDPAMFDEALPTYVNTRSPRVAAGLGTIARVVANGADIYQAKLPFEEALRRLHGCYWPYHQALTDLVDCTRRAFGACILVDCHSMPSVGGPMDRDAGHRRVDFVLGDCHGKACAATVMEAAAAVLSDLGYHVARNQPYAGGYVTRHYGRPRESVHCLQIEINRALYMDEIRIRRGSGMSRLTQDLRTVIGALGEITPAELAA